MNALKVGVSQEAIKRLQERYPSEAGTGRAVFRLKLALQLCREGKFIKKLPGRRGCAQDKGDTFPSERKIFDVELPPDKRHPEPLTIRIVTTGDLHWVVTVLPPEFRYDMAAKRKHRELRRITDETVEEESQDSVTQPRERREEIS